MVNPISPIRNAPSPELIRAPGQVGASGEFRSLLEGAIGPAERARGMAADSVERFLAGEGEELHSTVLAVQRAEMTLDLFLQVRNKVVQAYQEIMRMQV
jgi:flagellar hook-basal body complex protein FliE